MDHNRLPLPGTWIRGYCSSGPSDCAFLYGNRILFCQKFKEAAWLVHRNRPLQKSSGQLCEAARHDSWDEASYRGNRDCCNGSRIHYDELSSFGTDLPCCYLDVPSAVFSAESKDDPYGRSSRNISIVSSGRKTEKKK